MYTIENIKSLCRKGIANATVETWANCVRHVHVREKVEEHYRTIRGVLDDGVEQMVTEFKVRPKSEHSSSSETDSSKDEE